MSTSSVIAFFNRQAGRLVCHILGFHTASWQGQLEGRPSCTFCKRTLGS